MTERDEEWGPWIEHDGKGCPVSEGTFIRAEYLVSDRFGRKCVEGRFRAVDKHCGWSWSPRPRLRNDIIRYRIRKPRGMQILEGLLEQIDAPKPVEVPA